MGERVFTMDLTPIGAMSRVLLDGDDISSLLRGVTVHSSVGSTTTVALYPAYGQRANLTVRLPEARVEIADPDGDQMHVAFERTLIRLAGGEALTLAMIGDIFGPEFWSLLPEAK